jgi:hypothetical protein
MLFGRAGAERRHHFDLQPECTSPEMRRAVYVEVVKELTGQESEPWEIMHFEFYQSQIPVIEQAIEVARSLPEDDLQEVHINECF